jgi:hypothetical protein
LAAVGIVAWTTTAAPAEDDFVPLPNPEFTEGGDAPTGWKLSGGQGRWVDRQVLEVTGDGKGSNCWQCDYRFQPGALYRFQFRGRATAGGGCVISGPGFANHDWQLTPEWKWYGYVFRTPDNAGHEPVRLGQWEAKGTFQFDAVRLCRVVPVHCIGRISESLGEGETVRGGCYTFSGTFAREATNFHRTLESATAAFNSDRWHFTGKGHVTYLFPAPQWNLRTGRVTVNVNYRARGGCLVEVGTDSQPWRRLGTQDGVGTFSADVPEDYLRESFRLRLRGSTDDSNFQVDRMFVSGTSNDAVEQRGKTCYLDIERPSNGLYVEAALLVPTGPNGTNALWVTARQAGTGDLGAELTGTLTPTDGQAITLPKAFTQLDDGKPATFSMPLAVVKPGRNEIALQLAAPGVKPLGMHMTYVLPDYYRADYGALIGEAGEQAAVWWCDATHKIAPQRGLPEAKSAAAELSAARNDREAVQIVVRPEKPLKGFTAMAGPLVHSRAGILPAEGAEKAGQAGKMPALQILRVVYHFVEHPTDATGVADWWPDALPPIKRALDLPAGKNQPLWVLVYVPKDAKSGDYAGKITLRADGWSQEVPIKLHVWDFALPEKNHIDTALGLSPQTIWQYHQLKTEADKRRVFDMYLQSFADHRISPYDPVPLDPIGVKFLTEVDPPRAELDFARFDAAMARAIEKFHLTNFQVHLQGMGGGTFQFRVEPSIGKYGQDTPQYKAVMASYLGQLESHLREKGWLRMAYTYWFDEPDPKDYEFVRRGMERLKKHAPGLATMLTEEPGDALAGPIDIWCPVSFNYNRTEAEKRRAAGERLWWYVCCGPKAPHCTLFIDHPAVELRTWLWQSWQRNITGVLIWSTNWWTSPSAFPDKPQNPYEDPMGYVADHATPKGTKQFWGNGDGRFLYPPESAAVPGHAGSGPVIEPPVSSIRWEMLREGIEDYEYLYLLRELLAKRRGSLPAEQVKQYEELLTVPEAITRDMTTFSTDPAPIYARRKAIAEAIERLQR